MSDTVVLFPVAKAGLLRDRVRGLSSDRLGVRHRREYPIASLGNRIDLNTRIDKTSESLAQLGNCLVNRVR